MSVASLCCCNTPPTDCRVASHGAFAEQHGWRVAGPSAVGVQGNCNIYRRMYQNVYSYTYDINVSTGEATATLPVQGLGFENITPYVVTPYEFPPYTTANKEMVSATYDGETLRIDVKYQHQGNVIGPGRHPGLVLHTIIVDAPASPQVNLPNATANLTANWLNAPHGVGSTARLSYYEGFPPGGIIQEEANSALNPLARRNFPHGGFDMVWNKGAQRFAPDGFADVALFILEQTGFEIYFDRLSAAEFTSIVDIGGDACEFRSAYGGPTYCGLIDPLGGTYDSWRREAPNAIYTPRPGGLTGTFGADTRGEGQQRWLVCKGGRGNGDQPLFPIGTYVYPDAFGFPGRFLCS